MIPGIIADKPNPHKWYLQTSLSNPTPSTWSMFGSAVDISGDYAVFSTSGDDAGGANAGKVWVYKRNGNVWEINTEISSPGLAGDQFGEYVSIDGNYLAVSSRKTIGSFTRTGTVYVYTLLNGTWVFHHEIQPPVPQSNSGFGTNVRLSGDYIIAPATSLDYSGYVEVGQVYIFARNGAVWDLQTTILPSVIEHNRYFGSIIDISTDYAVIVDSKLDTAGPDTGGVIVYKRTGATWAQETIIPNPDPGTGISAYSFGSAVSLENNLLVVGNPERLNATGYVDSAVYVYELVAGTWSLMDTLTTQQPPGDTSYGASVGVSNTYLVVGDGATNNWEGRVFIYKRSGNTWNLQTTIDNPTITGDGEVFGNMLAVDGSHVVVGTMSATDDATGTYGSGVTYIYHNKSQLPVA